MPERVLLQPAPLEYELHHDRYDALVDELEAQGVLVRLLPPAEARSGAAPGEPYDLILHVGEVAGAIIGTANLIGIVRRCLHGYAQRRRLAKLYLYNGEEREFSLDEEDE
jgi:hypothetical protein